MKKRKLLTLFGSICLVLVLVALLLPACAKEEAPVPTPPAPPKPAPPKPAPPKPAPEVIKLKFSHQMPPGHLMARSFEAVMKHQLEEMSSGRLEVTIYGAAALGKAREQLDLVISGVADMGYMSTGYVPGRFPLNEVFNLPGLFPNSVTGSQVAMELQRASPALQDEFKGVISLSKWTTSRQCLAFTKKKVTKLEELAGMNMRTSGEIVTRVMGALGSPTTLVGSADLYIALDTGVLDGSLYTVASMPPLRLYEVCKYLLDEPISIAILDAYVNKDSFANLPPDLQAMVKVAGEQLSWQCAALYDAEADLAAGFMAEHGLEIYKLSPEEREKLYAALEPVSENWITEATAKGLPARELFDKLIEIRDEHVKRW